jgi:hypothetical protein
MPICFDDTSRQVEIGEEVMYVVELATNILEMKTDVKLKCECRGEGDDG